MTNEEIGCEYRYSDDPVRADLANRLLAAEDSSFETESEGWGTTCGSCDDFRDEVEMLERKNKELQDKIEKLERKPPQ